MPYRLYRLYRAWIHYIAAIRHLHSIDRGLTAYIVRLYHRVMGLEWNQLQLNIAKLRTENKVTSEIANELHCTSQSVWKVDKAIKAGDKPPSLDEDYIAAAPPPKVIGQAKPNPPDLTEVPTQPVTEKSTEGGAKGNAKGNAKGSKRGPAPVYTGKAVPVVYTSAVQFTANIQPIPITPDIFISYMVALINGYEGELVDWLSMVCRDFWDGRRRNMYEEYAGYTPHSEQEEEVEVEETGEEQKEEVADGAPA